MIHFYTHWKHRVDGMRRLRQTMDMAALTNVMGGMYKDAMKGAAIAAAQQGRRSTRSMAGEVRDFSSAFGQTAVEPERSVRRLPSRHRPVPREFHARFSLDAFFGTWVYYGPNA